MTPDMKLARTIANGMMIAGTIIVIIVAVAVIYAIASGDNAIIVPIVVIVFCLGLIIGFISGSKLKEFLFRRAARDVGRNYELRKRR